MKKIELDIRNIQTVKALHIYLRYMLELPAYYGCNLDALADVLGEESDEMKIVVLGPAPVGSELENYVPKLKKVMEECSAEHLKITCEFR
ncbi:MAG: barstar family protein [Clostridia bacterium]|nr:barstar family protein [Clostridia bacterium]